MLSVKYETTAQTASVPRAMREMHINFALLFENVSVLHFESAQCFSSLILNC